MSGHTRACRAEYSSARSALTFRRKQTRCIDSEVEVVDVVLVELRRRAEDDLALLADRVLAEPARRELLALLAADLAGRQGSRRVTGEVAEVVRVPQRELGDGAVLDELTHQVRRAEPGQLHLALVRRGGQVPRGRGDAHG